MYEQDNDIDSTDIDRAELQHVIDYRLHVAYQAMQFGNLISTIENCGIDRSFLYMYNQHGEISNCTTVHVPSLEEFDEGYRLTKSETQQLVTDMVRKVYLPSMEGNTFGDYFRAFYDDILKPFRAGWRWFQSICGQSARLSGRIESYINEIKDNKITKFEGDSVQMTSMSVLKRHLTNSVTKYREEANKIMNDLNQGHIDRTSAIDNADRMRELRDELRSIVSDIQGSVRHNAQSNTNISSISVNDLVKLGEEAMERLKSITKMNETYQGFWYTGWSTGKIHGLLGGVFPPLTSLVAWVRIDTTTIYIPLHAISVFFHRGVISTVSVGWQVLTLTVDADMALCRSIAKTMRTVLDNNKSAKK